MAPSAVTNTSSAARANVGDSSASSDSVARSRRSEWERSMATSLDVDEVQEAARQGSGSPREIAKLQSATRIRIRTRWPGPSRAKESGPGPGEGPGPMKASRALRNAVAGGYSFLKVTEATGSSWPLMKKCGLPVSEDVGFFGSVSASSAR